MQYVSISMDYGIGIKFDGSLTYFGSRLKKGVSNLPRGNDFIQVDTELFNCVALRNDGSLVAWGEQIDPCIYNYPKDRDFVQVVAGFLYYIALRSNGSLVAWGNNEDGQCDVPDGNDFVQIFSGEGYAAALKKDGTLVAWGNYPKVMDDIKCKLSKLAVSKTSRHFEYLKKDYDFEQLFGYKFDFLKGDVDIYAGGVVKTAVCKNKLVVVFNGFIQSVIDLEDHKQVITFCECVYVLNNKGHLSKCYGRLGLDVEPINYMIKKEDYFKIKCFLNCVSEYFYLGLSF